ncbi:plasmid stabilization system protein [Desulfosporosinus orientis DSM 765]|uniref:Plasmid stabilization system protein n=1 Tax=Desulfosporosinus orientis (strain ATCC 19365 / DSM 765 / NCIMB 8382 / VKM B-1628 / Singapore I) TaxID=768706 RepID=G7WDE0_DESOD|nr:type II toxin-antitoxin system RelE/ParE family toxin [Desulfosporosinus orientis]AET67909.1 plasmid stabilization system protein [Desulfosporosinus orientis DSM 765]
MYRLVVTEFANEDLDNIVSYIAVQLDNPMVAAAFLDEVERCYGFLKSNPLMYERCHDVRLEADGYRKATINNYVLVYKVDETAKTVIIYRFFYGAQNYILLI